MTTLALISDVHANLEALGTVLRAVKKEHVSGILFLGDIVGYGPDPDECIDLVQSVSSILVGGNHDWAAVGLTDSFSFNRYARHAIEWTAETLSDAHHAFLRTLPFKATVRDKNILLVHSSPIEPERWHYISSIHDAIGYFTGFRERICCVGHSHVPFIVERSSSGEIQGHGTYCKISKGSRYLINVGSVGQPRDGDPRAAYALMNDDEIKIKRVSYDIVITQKKMRKAGLPEYLIDRLAVGR